MEVGFRREGMRATVFFALCVCFAMAFFLSTQPQFRADSRSYMTRRLDLLRLKEVSSPESVFDAVMDVASAVREMVPTSSTYLSDPLTRVRRPTAIPCRKYRPPRTLPCSINVTV